MIVQAKYTACNVFILCPIQETNKYLFDLLLFAAYVNRIGSAAIRCCWTFHGHVCQARDSLGRFTSGPYKVVPANPSCSAPAESSPFCARVIVRRGPRFALWRMRHKSGTTASYVASDRCEKKGFRTQRKRDEHTPHERSVAHLC